MKRDGASVSLWQNEVEDYIPKPVDLAAANYDVLIVGDGITGIVTALLL